MKRLPNMRLKKLPPVIIEYTKPASDTLLPAETAGAFGLSVVTPSARCIRSSSRVVSLPLRS